MFQDKFEATAFKELTVVNWSGICSTNIYLQSTECLTLLQSTRLEALLSVSWKLVQLYDASTALNVEDDSGHILIEIKQLGNVYHNT